MDTDLQRRARAVGITDVWPYGASTLTVRAALVDWAENLGVRLSGARRTCLHWISVGRCGIDPCQENRGRHPWMDHVTAWNRAGTAALLLAQPYQLDDDDHADLADVATRFDLDVLLDAPGWYGHGTTAIHLRRPRAWRTT